MLINSMRQKGFFSIISVVLILIVATIIVSAGYFFIRGSLTSTRNLRSAQAFYVASGGLFKSQAIIRSGISCNGYNSGNVVLGEGIYNVTGATNLRNTTLSSSITSVSSSIPLNNASGFSSSGVISIDSEFIAYSSISGNSLIGVTRGINGTVAASHSSSALVSQNECILTSVGGVPSLSSPLGERKLRMILSGVAFGLGTTSSSGSGFVIPALVATGQINLSGGTIINPVVTSSSSSYTNSTALSGSTVVINNPGKTQISSNSGNLITSSSSGNIQPDVGQNSTLFNSGNLFSKFFTQSQSVIQANANQSYTSSTINGAQGQTIWFNGTLNINGNVTIGTPNSPVILIMANSNLIMSGNAKIYGFVYINPNFSLSMQGNSSITGAIAVNGPVNMNGSPSIILNPTILSTLNLINTNTSITYSNEPVSLQEVFQ